MGFFSSSAPAPQATLSGVGAPIGVLSTYTQHATEFTVKLREKQLSFSGDDFDITTPDGHKFMKMKGSTLSFRDKKTLYDINGAPLLNIRNKLVAIHKSFRIFAGEGDTQQLAEVKSHFSLGAKISIHIQNFDGQEVELKLKGSFFDRNALITWNDMPVARIDRSFLNAGELMFDNQTYYLTVAPHVDAALMIAVCVCLDEKKNEN